MNNLTPGVHAGIGSACAGKQWGLIQMQGTSQRGRKRARYGRDAGLIRKSSKRGSVVGDDEQPAPNLFYLFRWLYPLWSR